MDVMLHTVTSIVCGALRPIYYYVRRGSVRALGDGTGGSFAMVASSPAGGWDGRNVAGVEYRYGVRVSNGSGHGGLLMRRRSSDRGKIAFCCLGRSSIFGHVDSGRSG